MDKNYLQDVVPPAQKRSIRNIPIPSRDKRESAGSEINNQKEDIDIKIVNNQPPIQNNHSLDDREQKPPKKGRGKKILFSISILLILFLLFIVISSFDSAIVKVIPKTKTTTFNEKILIEELSNRSSNDSLGYRIIELSQQLSKTVEAIDEELVQKKASGEITIFNSYSEEPQKLIKNTRFESSDGRIYRIQDSIEVPGYSEGADGQMKPGEITVTVYADEIGEEHNLTSDEFTIPGFKGQEPYDFFRAKTKSAINGGYDGMKKVVSEATLMSSAEELENDLRAKLTEELNNEVTDEFYTLVDDDSFMFDDITELPIDGSDDVRLVMRGKIIAKVFNKVDISNSIASKLFPNDYRTDEDILIENFDNLSMEEAVGLEPVSEETNDDSEEISDAVDSSDYLNISGSNSKFVWQIDSDQLKKDLVGTDIKLLSNIMGNYSEIKNAEASVKPFWRSKYPEKEKDIKIEIVE